MATLPARNVEIVNLNGGIDLSSTFLNVDPGAARDLLNYEPALGGGYGRIKGYERTDGRPAPSAAVYYTVGVADASGISIGNTLTGDTSGATSKVVIKSGNVLGVTALASAYTLSETANGTTITATEVLGGISDPTADATWQLAAEDYYRALIGALPGDGPALYAFQYGSERFGFRSDAGAVKLYRSTATGWTLVAYRHVLFFDTGVMASEIVEGTLITGATSTATGTVLRFIKNAGSYGSTASGYMVVNILTGSFLDNEEIKVLGVTKCTADGNSNAITMSPGGKFQHVAHNFYGSTSTKRIYGCDGVNPAWEFDGNVLCPIYYPAPDPDPAWNAPKFIAAHKTFLFIAFATGQVAHSSPGTPLIFSGLLGAAEFGLGAEPAGMVSRSGDVLAIYTRDMTYGLYGTSVADWNLQVISETFGAQPYTVQKAGTVYAMDDKGIAPLERVDSYGDFESATVSRLVAPILEYYRGRVVASLTIKASNQYRLFFDDGAGLIMGDDQYLGESLPSFTTTKYAHIPVFVSSSEDQDGNEVILFGDANGYVYQSEIGYNFDGGDIECAYRSPFMHQKSPHMRKQYARLYLDLETTAGVTLTIMTELGYATPTTPTNLASTIAATGGGGYWGVDNWGEFYWDAAAFNSKGISLSGTSNNISVLVYGKSNVTRPYTLQTIELHYAQRRLRRG